MSIKVYFSVLGNEKQPFAIKGIWRKSIKINTQRTWANKRKKVEARPNPSFSYLGLVLRVCFHYYFVAKSEDKHTQRHKGLFFQ